MSQARHSLEYVVDMIDFLEQKIENSAVTPQILGALQQRLDAISATHANDRKFVQFYPHMLELQTLIHGEGGQEQKALLFMKEAVREAGGVKNLYSRLLQQYIAAHMRPASQPVVSPPKLMQHTPQRAVPANTSVAAPTLAKQTSASRRRNLFSVRKLAVGFGVVFVLAAGSMLTLHFVPRASALPNLIMKHSEIAKEKAQYDDLVSQYKACTADITSRKDGINPNDLVAVDSFNKDSQHCEDLLAQQKQVVARYNSLLGLADSVGTKQ